jgi:hypothetical protein
MTIMPLILERLAATAITASGSSRGHRLHSRPGCGSGSLQIAKRIPESACFRRCLAMGAPRADRPHARRNLSFGKLACRLIGGAGSGTVGIEERTTRLYDRRPREISPDGVERIKKSSRL